MAGHRHCIEDLKSIQDVYGRAQAAYSGQDTVELNRRFIFVHFVMTEEAFEQIKAEGLRGREAADVHRHAIGLEGSELTDGGYIFAYRLQGAQSVSDGIMILDGIFREYMSAENVDIADPPLIVTFSRAIYGVAFAGIEVYRDNESQTIIPVSCIDQRSLIFVEDMDVKYPFVWKN